VALPQRVMTRANAAVRVAVVDDSVVVRGLLSRWLSETNGIEVVGTYRSGREIIDALPGCAPRIILLDLDMPDMDGITALPFILSKSPDSRVIVVSSLSVHGAELTMRSLMKGATDYLPKPSNHREVSTSADFRSALIAKVLAVGGIRQLARGLTPPRPAAPVAAPSAFAAPAPAAPPVGRTPGAFPSSVPWATPATPAVRPSLVPAAPAHTPPSPVHGGAVAPFRAPAAERPHAGPRPFQRVRPRLVVIGASTGGPQALVAMLTKMAPVIAKVPVVIAQHMPPIFGAIFASHLKQHAGLPAVEATEGLVIQPGAVYMAPGGCHTIIKRKPDGSYALSLLPSEARGPWRPSIDLLFTSAAETCGSEALAMALTGMGRDGTEGAKDLVKRGANVVVQDEASSVVWGIPGSIAEAGLAAAMLPPEKLGELAVALLEGKVP
jgi:two-component system chemotaxis response regulator CheB